MNFGHLRLNFGRSWYITNGLPWLHELEINVDLRCWMFGFWFARKYYCLQLGPLMIAYRAGV